MMKDDLYITLLENGFNFDFQCDTDVCESSYMIKNVNILNLESNVESIEIQNHNNDYEIYISFKYGVTSNLKNFGLNVDMSGYLIGKYFYDENTDKCSYIYKKCDNKCDLIEELHRLNSIGQNIKG